MEMLALSESSKAIVKKTAKKKYKCPYCEARVERAKLHIHIQDNHEDMIPDGYTALRVAFNTINNKTEGHCIICKGVTDWNEDKGRYERLCNNPACHEAYKKLVAERTKRIYGTDRLQNDPRYADFVQKRALAGRSMAGTYKFTDGGEVGYMGTYERKLLEFMDTVMHCESEDILSPGPSIKYKFEGTDHIYISDFFYVPYNLIIEIKDGGRNRNTHPKRLGEEEAKIRAKEKAVKDLQMFNYVRVTDNDFGQLMSIMALLKYQLAHPKMFDDKFLIRVNESALLESVAKSEVDKNFVKKETIKLSSFKKIEITEELINKYKKEYPVLRHVRCKDTKEYICDGYMWMNDKDELVCYVGSCEYTDDHTKWIVSLEIMPDYKGHGLSKQILDFATKTMNCKYLSVNKDNKLTKKIYDDFGFKVYHEDKNMYYMSTDPKAKINESVMAENMSGTIGAALPLKNMTDINLSPAPTPYESDSNNYYLIQAPKMQNNAFAYGITKDPVQYSMLSVDPQEKGFYKVYKTDKGKFDKRYVTFKIKDKQSAKELYNELAKVAESTGEIYDSSFKSSNYIYEALTGGAIILDPDQLFCDSRFELVRNPGDQLDKDMGKLYQWLKGGNLDKLEEQVDQLSMMPSDEDIDYNVLPDGPMSVEQLKIWKDRFDGMSIEQRVISNDISMRKYGANCQDRYDAKYASVMNNIPPEVFVSEATFEPGEYASLIDKVKSVECDSSIIIMVLTDQEIPYSYMYYNDDDIQRLKEKWNRFITLPEEYRTLSTQTAVSIFGMSNEELYDKAITAHIERIEDAKDYPVDEEMITYYTPSYEILNSNPGKIFDENGYINAYSYIKALQVLECDLRNAKNDDAKKTIKEQIMNYGWNPEIPCNEYSLEMAQYRHHYKVLEEVDAKAFLEAQDSSYPKQLAKWLKSNITYKSVGKIKSPEQLEKDKWGDCHDQAYYSLVKLKENGYKSGIIFMVEYYNWNSPGGATHSACYYIDDDKYYWLENAWGTYAGIHGPYTSLNMLKKDIASKWYYTGKNDKLFMGPGHPKPGMTLNEYATKSTPENEVKPFATKGGSLNEAQDAVSTIPSWLTSDYLKDKIVPIFVILVHGKKLHSKGIMWFTDSEWSHSSLSLDSSLDAMYTFTSGIDNAPNKHHKTGFGIDTKERYLKEDPHMKVKIYALFITPEQKAEITNAIDWYIKHQDETAYSFKSILNIFMRRPTKRKMKSGDKCKMICSQFVYSILSLVNFKMRRSKDGSTISPADIDQLSDDTRFYVVYHGGLDTYDQAKVDEICYKLLPSLPMDMYGIVTESAKINNSSKFDTVYETAQEILEKK